MLHSHGIKLSSLSPPPKCQTVTIAEVCTHNALFTYQHQNVFLPLPSMSYALLVKLKALQEQQTSVCDCVKCASIHCIHSKYSTPYKKCYSTPLLLCTVVCNGMSRFHRYLLVNDADRRFQRSYWQTSIIVTFLTRTKNKNEIESMVTSPSSVSSQQRSDSHQPAQPPAGRLFPGTDPAEASGAADEVWGCWLQVCARQSAPDPARHHQRATHSLGPCCSRPP